MRERLLNQSGFFLLISVSITAFSKKNESPYTNFNVDVATSPDDSECIPVTSPKLNFVYLMSRHLWDTSLPKSPNSRKNLHSLTQLCQQIFLFICSYQTSIRIILINSLNQLKTTAQISVLNRLSLLAYKSENTIIVKVWKVQCLKNCYHWLKKGR